MCLDYIWIVKVFFPFDFFLFGCFYFVLSLLFGCFYFVWLFIYLLFVWLFFVFVCCFLWGCFLVWICLGYFFLFCFVVVFFLLVKKQQQTKQQQNCLFLFGCLLFVCILPACLFFLWGCFLVYICLGFFFCFVSLWFCLLL